ncbi:MAG: hypothetical protein RIT27_2044 [Pseudomonadota bacterium]|jgi:VanZ family protein
MKTIPLHYLKVWRGIGYLLVGIVVMLSVISPSSNPELFRINDKIGHFLAYATLMGWFAQYHEKPDYKYLAAIFIAQGILLEVVQTFLPDRMGDIFDALTNTMGVFVAWYLSTTFLGKTLLHFEQWIRKF